MVLHGDRGLIRLHGGVISPLLLLGGVIRRPLMLLHDIRRLLHGIRRLLICCCRVKRRPLLLCDGISGPLMLLHDIRRRVMVLHGDRGLMQLHGGVTRSPRLLLCNGISRPPMLLRDIRRFKHEVDVVGRQLSVLDKSLGQSPALFGVKIPIMSSKYAGGSFFFIDKSLGRSPAFFGVK